MISRKSSTGARVTVTAGGTTGNVNVALEPLGSVSGTVTSAAGALLQNVTVTAVMRLGASVVTLSSATTNASGVYTISRLPAGTVYLYTSNSQGFVNEIFDNIVCVGLLNKTRGEMDIIRDSTSQFK